MVFKSREEVILKSPIYMQAVAEWKGIQEWCKNHKGKRTFEPFTLTLNIEGFNGYKIFVDFKDGIPFLPDDLSATEFILSVRQLREILCVEDI